MNNRRLLAVVFATLTTCMFSEETAPQVPQEASVMTEQAAAPATEAITPAHVDVPVVEEDTLVTPTIAPTIIAEASTLDADAPATEDETEMCSYMCRKVCKGMRDKNLDKLELDIEREENNEMSMKLEEDTEETEVSPEATAAQVLSLEQQDAAAAA